MEKKHRISIMSAIGLFALVAAMLFPAESFAAEAVTKADRFQLWNECKPIDLVVEVDSKKVIENAVPTKDAIEIAVRSRLRAAGLYDPDGRAYLNPSVIVVSNAFNVTVEFSKIVRDLVSNEVLYGDTWVYSGTGIHSGNSNFILSIVTRYVDRFLDEYLRVNDSACSR